MAERIEVVDAWEKTSPILTGQLVDEDGAALTATDLNSVLFRLYNLDDSTQAIINSRSGVEVLKDVVGSTDEFTIDNAGMFRMKMQVSDNVISDQTRSVERHQAEFILKWDDNDGAERQSSIYINVNVRNAAKVT